MKKRDLAYTLTLFLAATLTLVNVYYNRKQTQPFRPLIEISNLAHEKYVSEVKQSEMVDNAIKGMLHGLDKHSTYITASERKEFDRDITGNYVGIGANISAIDDGIVIVSPLSNSPAEEAHLAPGDIIITIEGESTIGWTTSDAANKLTGKAGTDVSFTVQKTDQSTKEYTLTRRKMGTPVITGWRRNTTDSKWNYILDNDNLIGYLMLTQFSEDIMKQFDEKMQQLIDNHNIKGIIVDLRGNPGGLLPAAIKFVERFVGKKLVVSTDGKHSKKRDYYGNNNAVYGNIEIVILINEGSASASEIVSGALQAHKKSIIIGARSYGKGSVQQIYEIPKLGSAVKITTDYYYLPDGKCVHKKTDNEIWGVQPDIKVDMNREEILELIKLRNTLRLGAANGHSKTDSDITDSIEHTIQNDYDKLMEIDLQLKEALKQCRLQLEIKSAKTAPKRE